MNAANESTTAADGDQVPMRAEWGTVLISSVLVMFLLFAVVSKTEAATLGSGDLALVIERANGSVQIVETTGNSALTRVEGLGTCHMHLRCFPVTSAMPSCSVATAV